MQRLRGQLKQEMVQVTLVSKTASVAETHSVVVTDYSVKETEMKWAKEIAMVMGQVQQAVERAPLAKACSALESAPTEMGCLSVNQVAVRAAAVRAWHGSRLKKFPPTTKSSTSV